MVAAVRVGVSEAGAGVVEATLDGAVGAVGGVEGLAVEQATNTAASPTTATVAPRALNDLTNIRTGRVRLDVERFELLTTFIGHR